jgi:hypothetical protein
LEASVVVAGVHRTVGRRVLAQSNRHLDLFVIVMVVVLCLLLFKTFNCHSFCSNISKDTIAIHKRCFNSSNFEFFQMNTIGFTFCSFKLKVAKLYTNSP